MAINTAFRLPSKAPLHGSHAITRPGKQIGRFKLRPLWLTVHRYLALTVGFLFVLIGLTGSLNVFNRELDELLNPEFVLEHTPGAPRHSYDEILQIVRAAYPRAAGSWTIEPPDHPSGMLHLGHWAGGPEVQGLMVTVDPYTGEVVKSRFWGKTLTSWIYDLHSSLQMGGTGRNTLGIVGLFSMVSLITGVYLWWPKGGKWRQAFTLKRGASPERWVFDIHKLCGISGVSVLFISAFTGVYLDYGDYLHPLVNWLSPIRETPPFKAPEGLTSKVIPGAATLSITQAIAIGRQRFPNAELTVITTPEGPAGVYELRMRLDRRLGVSLRTPTFRGGKVLLGLHPRRADPRFRGEGHP